MFYIFGIESWYPYSHLDFSWSLYAAFPWYPLLGSYFLLLDGYIYLGCLSQPVARYSQFTTFLQLLFTRCLLISCRCLLLNISYKVHGTSSAHQRTLLLDCCCWLRAMHPPSCHLFSLKIFFARVPIRCLLYAAPFCYWQLATRCYFFAVCCPLTVRFLLLADWSLVTRPVPLIASWLNAYYMSLAIPRSLLRFTVRFLAFVSGKSPLAPRRLF